MDINTYNLLSCGEILKINDQKEFSFLFGSSISSITIIEDKFFINRFFLGKIVMAKIIYNKKREQQQSFGILNSIKNLKDFILNSLAGEKIKQIKIENKVIEEGDIRSLYSLGIKNDFTCFVEYEE